jgi:hypothetical protein
MESVVAALVSVALILFAALTVTQGTLSTHSDLSESWKAMEVRSGELTRTEIAVPSVTVGPGGTTLDATISNDGSLHLKGFENWDVVLQYYDGTGGYYITKLVYTSSATPNDDEWTVEGIYLDAGIPTPETFEPGILNPGEEMVITIKPNPAIGNGTTDRLIVGTPNGVTASAIFSY